MSDEPRRVRFDDLRSGAVTRRTMETPTFTSKVDASIFAGGGEFATQKWVLEQLRKLGIEAACEGTNLTVKLTGKPE